MDENRALEGLMLAELATVAFKEQKRAAEALSEHAKGCWVCRNRAARFLLDCWKAHGLALAHMLAKVDADHYRERLSALRLTTEGDLSDLRDASGGAPSLEWVEALYRLEDPRR